MADSTITIDFFMANVHCILERHLFHPDVTSGDLRSPAKRPLSIVLAGFNSCLAVRPAVCFVARPGRSFTTVHDGWFSHYDLLSRPGMLILMFFQ